MSEKETTLLGLLPEEVATKIRQEVIAEIEQEKNKSKKPKLSEEDEKKFMEGIVNDIMGPNYKKQ